MIGAAGSPPPLPLPPQGEGRDLLPPQREGRGLIAARFFPPPGGREGRVGGPLENERSLFALLLGDWLESWRGIFARHGLLSQWAFIGTFTAVAALALGLLSHAAFANLSAQLGPRMPAYGMWMSPFLSFLAYGWFFLTTIWLGRTYRRRERVIPLLLSPLSFSDLAAYLMLRDTGLPLLLLSVLGLPFVVGGMAGAGAPAWAIAMAFPLWGLLMLSALAMANVAILLLFRILPAGWEGPMSFATANVLILMLPFLTHGLGHGAVPFYWPGLLATTALKAHSPWLALQAMAGLGAIFLALMVAVRVLTERTLHANWSKSEELVPSGLMGKVSFLAVGQGPMTSLILKDWMLTARAWGEAAIVVILLGVSMRLKADLGVPVVEFSGAPLLGAMIMAWAVVELLGFLGESHKEGPNTLVLTMSPLSVLGMVWAKFIAIALPRLALGEGALLIATMRGDLSTAHAVMGQAGLILMVCILSWLEVAQAFSASEDRLPGWLKLWDQFYDFWRLILIYPAVGLVCVIGTQVAAIAYDQGVSGFTGMIFGVIGVMACMAAMFCRVSVGRKLG